MVRGSRRYRLTGAGAFEQIFRTGVRREGDFLQLVSVAAAREWGRVGFVIGRRSLPLAVDRNRVRRMLRATLHEARASLAGHDVIVRLKRRPSRAEFPMIAAEAARLLATLAPRHGSA